MTCGETVVLWKILVVLWKFLLCCGKCCCVVKNSCCVVRFSVWRCGRFTVHFRPHTTRACMTDFSRPMAQCCAIAAGISSTTRRSSGRTRRCIRPCHPSQVRLMGHVTFVFTWMRFFFLLVAFPLADIVHCVTLCKACCYNIGNVNTLQSTL